jgi:competence protein CoiA
MQFALVGNERTAPSPGLTGSCPVCGHAMVAKCGSQRTHHWAHRGKRACDSWWEPETLWHRTWKSRYPVQWRETIQHGQNGDKHIADVLTEHGLTIEFQHSRLKPTDRAARESFYGSMVWVVDGSRLVRDMPRFIEGVRSFCPSLQKGLYIAPSRTKRFRATG